MRPLGRMYGLRRIREDAVGLLEECAAACGERHPPPVACKERYVELVFETADFPAEMRLCHPKPRGSACEAQLFRDRDEELEMAIFHVPALLYGLRLNYAGKKSWTHRPSVPTISVKGTAYDRPARRRSGTREAWFLLLAAGGEECDDDERA